MPNAINFGPAMPGKKYTAHNANEYKEVPDLDADMQMFTEMLVRIGNLSKCSSDERVTGGESPTHRPSPESVYQARVLDGL